MSGVDGAAPEQGEKGGGKKSRKNKTSKSRRRGRSNTGDNAAERTSRGTRNTHGDGAGRGGSSVGGYKATHGLGVDDRDSGHAGAVTSCAFSPDGTKLVSTGADGLVKVWNARQAKLQATLRGHRAEVLCCAWARSSINNNTGGNSDGGEAEEAASASSGGDVASGGADHRVRLWRPDTDFVPKVDEPGGRGWRPEWTFDGHTGPVTGVAFTKRARRVASVSWDGSMRLWCIETMTSLASIQVVSMGDVDNYVRLRSVACCPTDDDRAPDDGDEEDESGRGGRVITCCDDGTCQVWRPLLGTQIAVLRPPLSLMGMAGGDAEGFDDSSMGGGMGDAMLTTASTASSMACLSCDWSSDGARIMCGFGDGRVALWDAARVAPEIRTVCIREDMDERSDAHGDQGEEREGRGARARKTAGSVEVACVAFAPGAEAVAVASADGKVRVLSFAAHGPEEGGTMSVAIASLDCDPTWVCFSPDGALLACAAEDGSVHVHRTRNGFTGGDDFDASASLDNASMDASGDDPAFSPGAAKGEGGERRGQSTDHRKEDLMPNVAVLQGHDEVATHCTFSSDGALLASCSWDETVRIWETAAGSDWVVRAIYRGHVDGGWVRCAAFHPYRSDTIVSSSDSGQVEMWQVPILAGSGRTGGEAAVVTADSSTSLVGHDSSVMSCVFDQGGSLLLTADDAGNAIVWNSISLEQVATYHVNQGISAAVFSPCGGFALLACLDASLRLFDRATGNECVRLGGHQGELTCVATGVHAERGCLVATAGKDGTFRLWDLDFESLAS